MRFPPVTPAIRRRRRRGFTLLEFMAVMSLAAIVVGGLFMLFGGASSDSKANAALLELGTIEDAVKGIGGGQSDFSWLDVQDGELTVAGSSRVPAKFVKGTIAAPTGMTDPFNGAVTIRSANTDENYTVTFANIPPDACATLVGNDYGTSLESMTVVGGTAVQARAMTPAEAKAACGAAGGAAVSIAWTLY
jgi:prepilin-type N-terminal cleavage/methylation domain-containing protein